jgi:hypothetical protein
MEDDELYPPDDYIGAGLRRCAPLQWDCDYFGTGYGRVDDMHELVKAKMDEVRGGDKTAEQGCLELQTILEEMLEAYLVEIGE